jgi:hypothetical protein
MERLHILPKEFLARADNDDIAELQAYFYLRDQDRQQEDIRRELERQDAEARRRKGFNG